MEGQLEQTSSRTNPWLLIILIIVVLGAAGFFVYNYFSSKINGAALDPQTTVQTAPQSPEQTVKTTTTDLENVDKDIKALEKDLDDLNAIDSTEDTAPEL